MEISAIKKIVRTSEKHKTRVPQQTGFASAATHYLEPTVDLNQELVSNKDAAFFLRVDGDGLKDFNILDRDVLIVDRSLSATPGRLAVTIQKGQLEVDRIPFSSEEKFRVWGMISYIIHRAR